MRLNQTFTRRQCLQTLTAGTLAGQLANPVFSLAEEVEAAQTVKPKPVAAIITKYEKRLHGDVIVGKILEGWKQDGGAGPALRLASMYVDQSSPDDLGHLMSVKHNVPVFSTIEETMTLGGNEIQVEGVISVAEHGNYPWNEKQQHLYPRRRFFEEITDTFQKYGRVVPVFSDKHLGPVWSDAKWMYDRGCQLNIPMMAGSSLPVSFRRPEISLPLGCEIEAAIGIGYSGLDIYGSHTLDCFQSVIERRRSTQMGVEWVQYLQGDAMWQVMDKGVIRKDVFEAALAVLPKQGIEPDPRKGPRNSLFLIQYTDGLLGAIFMLPDCVQGISTAIKLKHEPQPLATYFVEKFLDNLPHFAYLMKAIERMMHTGRPSYPVERTLLSSGILDRALTSRMQNSEKLMCPELAINYEAVDYPYAPNPRLDSNPTLPLSEALG